MSRFNKPKLTPNQAREICIRAWLDESQRTIAQEFKTTPGMVSQIKLGYNYPGHTVDIRRMYQSDNELSEREAEQTYKMLESSIIF